ncbi:MAG: ParB N-terminal domain-containing protein [Acidobacteria bacterium]|nr:ParB N-terminal domain-containing protein [Acidobacteriota bacterium]
MTDIRSPSIRSLPVDELRLDDENPRLPERIRGRPQSEILRFLYENGVLEEIAQSYMDHGFFQNEPLIVTREHGQSYTVIEGNRRLATLKVLLGAPEADDLRSLVEPSPDRIEQLAEVPCFVVSSRDEIRAYVGFRHIGGIKTWDPEAKARYVLGEVARLVEHGSRDPFRELGRRIGSNTQSVRNSYLAIRILRYAREEFGLDVSYLQDNRFGVWRRCMDSADIRRHIGLGQERTYAEIENALHNIDGQRLAEVVGDLGSRPGRRSVLGDSRNVTTYGRVLANEHAHKTLRQTNDLSLARKIVEDLDTVSRAWRLVDEVRLLMDAILGAEITEDLLAATEQLHRLARSVRDITKGRAQE